MKSSQVVLMIDFFVNYAGSNIVCVIIFFILLTHNLLSIDRQEKQIKYDYTLIAFILYFLSDCYWAALEAGLIPLTRFHVVLSTLLICVFMTLITYTWLNYVMAVEQTPHRNRPINQFAVLFPFLASLIALVLHYIISPNSLIDENNVLLPTYNYYLVVVPYIYIASVLVYTIRKARREENPIEKRRHLIIGFFPLMVIAGGLVEMLLFPHLPIFCFCSTILMLIFFIQSMDRLISLDPLTGLNNRGQLIRYISVPSNVRKENVLTYVVMFDINDFKMINDEYSHAEGDKALIIVANALKNVSSNHRFPLFLGRYGGDEFIMIVHPESEKELVAFLNEIRKKIDDECHRQKLPYILTVGIGYDQLYDDPDTIHRCMLRADKKLYLDKDYMKAHNQSSHSI